MWNDSRPRELTRHVLNWRNLCGLGTSCCEMIRQVVKWINKMLPSYWLNFLRRKFTEITMKFVGIKFTYGNSPPEMKINYRSKSFPRLAIQRSQIAILYRDIWYMCLNIYNLFLTYIPSIFSVLVQCTQVKKIVMLVMLLWVYIHTGQAWKICLTRWESNLIEPRSSVDRALGWSGHCIDRALGLSPPQRLLKNMKFEGIEIALEGIWCNINESDNNDTKPDFSITLLHARISHNNNSNVPVSYYSRPNTLPITPVSLDSYSCVT
jgi:hypothetical protein